jgi:hypothetical protein
MERKKRTCERLFSQSEGFRHIEEYFRSGLRPCEYYKQHHIGEHQFYSWRRRYLAAHPEMQGAIKAKKHIYPVRIDSPPNIRPSGLEIHYPHGVRVVIADCTSMGIDQLSSIIKLQV